LNYIHYCTIKNGDQTSSFATGVESPAAGELAEVSEIFAPVSCTLSLETDQQFPSRQMHCLLLHDIFAGRSSFPPQPVA
ncbi:hypothetical protein T09_840, partial [Trichinella sp. T9]